MALVICPYCGRHVEGEAGQCSFCGGKFQVTPTEPTQAPVQSWQVSPTEPQGEVSQEPYPRPPIRCPRCGEVSVGSPYCNRCGLPLFTGGYGAAPQNVSQTQYNVSQAQYGYPPTPTPAPQAAQGAAKSDDKDSDPIVQWLKANPKEQKWLNPMDLFLSAVDLIPFFLALGFIFTMLFAIERPYETLYKNDNYLELVLNYKIYIRNAWILAICLALCLFASTIIRCYKIMWVKRCSQWMISKNINFRAALLNEPKEFLSNPMSGTKKWNKCDIPNAGRLAIYYSTIKKNGSMQIFACIIQCLSEIILLSLLFDYTARVCNIIRDNVVFGMHSALGPEFLIDVLIIFVIALAIMLIVFCVRKAEIGKEKKFIEEEISQK